MEQLQVERTRSDELLRKIEQAVTEAVQRNLDGLRKAIDRLEKSAYLQKTWLTLDEAARYADITTTTLREWREAGLPQSKVQGRIYIKRSDLDAFIGEH